MKRNLIKQYNLPEKVIFCKNCTISNQRPRITFNENGICSACTFANHKQKATDWSIRERELIELCNKHRKSTGEYDVIVPCSGGKDGSFVAHQLKYRYNMNPLCVTWAPLKYTSIGRKNLDSFIESGFNHILGTPDRKVTRRLTQLSFEHLGDPFQPFIYGQANFPMHVAVQNNIKLIMYGENGEVEYGGNMENANKPNKTIKDQDDIYFSGLPPEFWKDFGISDQDLFPFKSPSYDKLMTNGTEIHFMGYYKFWDPQENFYYCREHVNFAPNSERSEGTFSKYASLDDQLDGFHFYLAYIKFGIGRTTSDASHEIRDNKITREEGIALIKKYDHEFPRKYYDVFLEYCGITNEEFNEVIDSWRSDHIWYKDGTEWRLRKAIWH